MSQTHLEPEREANTPPRTPRWVKAFGIIALVIILLFGVLLLTGEHGPGRHMPPTEQGTQQP